MTICRAREASRFADKRASDNPAYSIRIGVAACCLTNVVEHSKRNDFVMRRDLEDGIRGGVQDRFGGANVLCAELVQNLGAAARVIADEVHIGFTFNRPNEFIWEPFERGERFMKDDAGDFPMTSGGVLAGGALAHATVAGAVASARFGGTCFRTSPFIQPIHHRRGRAEARPSEKLRQA